MLDELVNGERKGPAFSVSVRARAWDQSSSPSTPASGWAVAVERVLRARAGVFVATGTHPNLSEAITHASDSIVLGPFVAETSLHLVVGLLLGLLDDAPRKSSDTDQPSALASLDGAREDLGNAFVDAWIARNEQTHAMRSE